MNRYISFLIALTVFSAAAFCDTPQDQIAEDSGLEALAKDFIQLLTDRNFPEATEHFAPVMKEAMPIGKLKEVCSSLFVQAGPFVEQIAVRTEKLQGYDVVFVTCKFEKAILDAKVVFDSEKQITGLFFVPSQTSADSPTQASAQPFTGWEAPAYVKTDSFYENQIKAGAGYWLLPGTLTIPKGNGPFPAVVLVHGSGPHDRDESIGPNKPFRDLAWGLASKGIAVVRYEKRSKNFPLQTEAMMSRLTVKEETIDDALATVDILRKMDKIDTDKIFVLGHSLGGSVVPRMGKADSGIAGFIVMAGSARPMEDVILEQFIYIFSLDEVISETEKVELDGLKRQVAEVKSSDLSRTTPASNLPFGIPPAYWLDLRGYSPAEAAKELSQPMLILQAGRDYQVTQDDFQLWQKALSSREDVEFKSYENLNHLFIEGQGKSTPAEYQIPGHISQVVIEEIADWIKKL